MAEVLIVGRTRMKSGICLGGLDLDTGRSLRLLTAKGENPPINAAFNLGDAWELGLRPLTRDQLTAPHTEDVCVISKEFVRKMSVRESISKILQHRNVASVYPRELYDGRLYVNNNGKAAITPQGGIPVFSTEFWRLLVPLTLSREINSWGKAQNRYLPPNDILTIPYVGFEQPQETIPANTILRFSLSRWFNNGFWLQLSGWFL